MTNDILRKRVCALFAQSYAMTQEDVYCAYLKLGSFDKILHLLETGQLQQVIAEIGQINKIEDR